MPELAFSRIIVPAFKAAGISVRTSNADGRSMADLKTLWERYYSEAIASKIPGRVDGETICIYADYQSDFRREYSALVGCRVKSLDGLPAGIVGRDLQEASYAKFVARGIMPDAIVGMWKEIWDRDKSLDRSYTADFEVYGPKFLDPENAEVEIYVATKKKS